MYCTYVRFVLLHRTMLVSPRCDKCREPALFLVTCGACSQNRVYRRCSTCGRGGALRQLAAHWSYAGCERRIGRDEKIAATYVQDAPSSTLNRRARNAVAGRPVTIRMTDLERTEVIRGLRPGETVSDVLRAGGLALVRSRPAKEIP